MSVANINEADVSGGGTSGLFSPETDKIIKEIEELKIGNYYPNTLTKRKSIEETLFDACADVKIATSQVSMHLDRAAIKKIFHQIDLMHNVNEWNIDEQVINVNSYKSFLKWFLFVNPTKGPGLGLSHQGNLVAAWMNKLDRLILEFYPNEQAKWMIKSENNGEIETGSGQSSILRLPKVLAPYEVKTNFFQVNS
jgi:hypothetical protein